MVWPPSGGSFATFEGAAGGGADEQAVSSKLMARTIPVTLRDNLKTR
ncbi:hypothetical protein ACFQ3W_05365 [Paenibacillus puldeungensis]|uniref:Uncharacterized protein n=1 Tax=Paenibacillus puldeungensis TaxID=696536 RepID=A0ABW3RTV1_9BACL